MTKYEQMQRDLFAAVKNCGSDGYFIKPHLIGRDLRIDIETRHVREKLIEWAEAGLIKLDVYTEKGFRPYTDWPTTDDFFEQGNKVGHVRVKLLAAGDEFLDDLKEIKHRKIGF